MELGLFQNCRSLFQNVSLVNESSANLLLCFSFCCSSLELFQGSIKYVKPFTCSCNLATQNDTEADERKRIYDLATHKFSVFCISLLKRTDSPHQKDVSGKKVTFESPLFFSLDMKTSNIPSCLMAPFFAPIL